MKRLVVLLLIALCAASKTRKTRHILLAQSPSGLFRDSGSVLCNEVQDVTLDYLTSFYDFTLQLFNKLGARSDLHFVFSTFSIWRSLAALAEGADPVVQPKMFQAISLPSDPCIRQKYYDLMNQRILPGDDININNQCTLVLDENLNVNENWLSTVFKYSMLNITFSPIRRYPFTAANHMRQIISAPLRPLNLNGNSVMLDSIEYSGLWTTAFDDAVIQRAPFHDQLGQKIGSVDLMTMRKRVKMVYVPIMNMKVLELPIGADSRYRLIMGVILSKDNNILHLVHQMTAKHMLEMLDNLKESKIPIEVAIPRFSLTSDIDVRTVVEDIGLEALWDDPAATRFVSEPSALPSSYVQRATLSFDKQGVSPALQVQEPASNASTGLDPILGRDFIANKPFLLSIMDAETHTALISVAYSKPTYSY